MTTPESTEPHAAAKEAAWKIIIAFLDDLDYNPPSLFNDAADLVRRLESAGLTIAPADTGRRG